MRKETVVWKNRKVVFWEQSSIMERGWWLLISQQRRFFSIFKSDFCGSFYLKITMKTVSHNLHLIFFLYFHALPYKRAPKDISHESEKSAVAREISKWRNK